MAGSELLRPTEAPRDRFKRRFKLETLVPHLIYVAVHIPPPRYRLLTTDGLTG